LVGRVVFGGRADNDRLLSAYRDATVVVIPSTYESFSLVALEAAAAGTPVLMTDTCGLAGTFRTAGFRVTGADARSLGNAMALFINDRDLRESQRRASNRLPWETFSWPSVARAVLAVYETVLDC
jgi:glycosyltransferase involved in cell wall biosynthesis